MTDDRPDPKEPGIGEVELNGSSTDLSRAALRGQLIVSTVTIAVGSLVLLAGVAAAIAGLTGAVTIKIQALDVSGEIQTSVLGLAIALIGAVVAAIGVRSYRVKMADRDDE